MMDVGRHSRRKYFCRPRSGSNYFGEGVPKFRHFLLVNNDIKAALILILLCLCSYTRTHTRTARTVSHTVGRWLNFDIWHNLMSSIRIPQNWHHRQWANLPTKRTHTHATSIGHTNTIRYLSILTLNSCGTYWMSIKSKSVVHFLWHAVNTKPNPCGNITVCVLCSLWRWHFDVYHHLMVCCKFFRNCSKCLRAQGSQGKGEGGGGTHITNEHRTLRCEILWICMSGV